MYQFSQEGFDLMILLRGLLHEYFVKGGFSARMT